FEEHDQVVDRAELVQGLAERVDLAMAARHQIENVGLDLDARADEARDREQDQRRDEDELEPLPAESLDAEESSLLAPDRRLAGRMVAHRGGLYPRDIFRTLNRRLRMDALKPAAADLVKLEDDYGAHNYHPLDVVVHKASGCWVWDVNGEKYLDFLAAYSAV